MEKKEKNKRRFLWLFYRIVTFLLVIIPIVLCLPRETKFKYAFELGSPWKYGLLTAEYEFPIYKEEARLKHERDSVMKFYKPYYILSDSVRDEAVNAFKDSARVAGISSSVYEKHVLSKLQEIYRHGVISSNDYEKLLHDSINSLYIVKGTVAEQVRVKDLLTEKMAYSGIIVDDMMTVSSAVLKSYNLNQFILPNLVYDTLRSETAKSELMTLVSAATGRVMTGQKIIDRGEIVNRETYNILKSLALESEKRKDKSSHLDVVATGQTIYVFILISCLFLYLDLFKPIYLRRRRNVLLIFGLIVASSVITSLISSAYTSEYVYALPYVLVPIVVGIFFDSRTAVIVNIINILICSMSLTMPQTFIVMQFVAGMVGVYSLRELSQRSQFLNTAFIVFLVYSLVYFSIELIAQGSLENINYHRYIYIGASSIILLFIYPMLLVLEKMFGFTSNVTLVELSNVNNKVLREMSEIAPGTFQHSMQVSNLAAAAAMKIGANAQLVRTGALYHDIGKMKNPAFFTENQNGVNPHSQLSFKESAQIIIEHIYDGLKLADKYNLPASVRRFISTHHGKGLTKYFYISYKNAHPDEDVDLEEFTYPGPNPGTKEEAILMMADSVEAASRSLKEYTEENIAGLVDKIVDSQLEEGYFMKCPITFADIDEVKNVFKEKLRIMYHTRISYPELKSGKGKNRTESDASSKKGKFFRK